MDDSKDNSNEAIANKIAEFITVNNLYFLEDIGSNFILRIIESSHDHLAEKLFTIPENISTNIVHKISVN